ncbi:MAG: hypothetical protein WC500_02670 [Candidatus Margulisiibacteriota bacterium]
MLKPIFQPQRAGSLPADFAGRQLSPAKNGRVELARLGRALPVAQNDVKIRPPMSGIHCLAAKMAVMVDVNQLPEAIKAPYLLSGEGFAKDFEQYLSAVVFFESIRGRNGEWTNGFELSMLELEAQAFGRLTADATELSRADGRGIVFLSSTTPDGSLIPGEELHWGLSWFIGRLRADNLALGETGRDCAAAIYQSSMLRYFISGKMRTDQGFFSDPLLMQYLKCLVGFNELIISKAGLLTEPEKNTIAAHHEKGWSIDSVVKFNRATVEGYLTVLQET